MLRLDLRHALHTLGISPRECNSEPINRKDGDSGRFSKLGNEVKSKTSNAVGQDRKLKEGFHDMVHVALALVMLAPAASEKYLKYEDAFALARKQEKPLLVVVGASWCASCQILKTSTIQPMKESGDLKKVVISYVDKDERPELAKQLMKGATLPQIILYNQNAGSWKRYSLIGIQTKKRMTELLTKANAQAPGKLSQ